MFISIQRIHLGRRLGLLMTVLFFALFSNLNAQSVTGKISDEKGESLPGVSVLVKGTTNGVIIDKVNKITGLDITFVTTADTNEEAFELLKELGMPFKNIKK